ncbi:MAG TPA: DUF3883 domain-containing protein [Pirellulales bacterium]|nr:DUF3883 domain-containing protein [Pirellulales bacterium]
MTVLSPGLLYSAQKLIDTVAAHPMDRDDYLWSFRTMLVSPAEGVLQLSTRCGWIAVNEQLGLEVTEMGRYVQSFQGADAKLRVQIRDFIQAVQPSWTKLLPAGRAESLPFMPEPARQCFREAGLSQRPPTDDVISWWDEMAAAARGRAAVYLAQIGRNGERCSIEFETRRVGRRPHWQSVESNKSGFDVLSMWSRSDPTDLQIEVKASPQHVAAASLHLTRREWEAAQTAVRYLFHIWSITDSAKQLAVLPPLALGAHVPTENGEGRWETIEVPYKSFESEFRLVEIDSVPLP